MGLTDALRNYRLCCQMVLTDHPVTDHPESDHQEKNWEVMNDCWEVPNECLEMTIDC